MKKNQNSLNFMSFRELNENNNEKNSLNLTIDIPSFSFFFCMKTGIKLNSFLLPICRQRSSPPFFRQIED
jgi:hypothetical protein